MKIWVKEFQPCHQECLSPHLHISDTHSGKLYDTDLSNPVFVIATSDPVWFCILLPSLICTGGAYNSIHLLISTVDTIHRVVTPRILRGMHERS